MYVLLIVSLCASIYVCVCVCVFVCVRMDACIQSCGQAVNHHTLTIMHIHKIYAFAYACRDANKKCFHESRADAPLQSDIFSDFRACCVKHNSIVIMICAQTPRTSPQQTKNRTRVIMNTFLVTYAGIRTMHKRATLRASRR